MPKLKSILLATCALASAIQPADGRSRSSSPTSTDLGVISRIKDEGINRSRVMTYARVLNDEIGARLTGSPPFQRAARWASDRLSEVGAVAHLEAWGPFGLSWEQTKCSLVLRGASPAVFVAQATPWSPATPGAVVGDLVRIPEIATLAELDAYRGKLSGRFVLYGPMPANDPDTVPGFDRLTPDDLRAAEQINFRHRSNVEGNAEWERRARFNGEVAKFLTREGALAVIVSNGSGKTFVDDNGTTLGFDVYRAGRHQALPSAVMEADGFHRLARLLDGKAPVSVELEIGTRTGAADVDGLNVIGDIPGTDPAREDEVVMIGAHLDSWIAATGATDDGAPMILELEAVRILHAVGYRPRRPLRVAFWGGEEEGELGSRAYVARHLAVVTALGGDPELPEDLRPVAAYRPRPGYRSVSAYFNMDGGGGRVIGLLTGGNDAAAATFRRWLDPLADIGVTLVSPHSAEGVDRVSFSDVGIPAFDVAQEPRDYDTRTHHTNLDAYDRLSEPDLKQAATALAVLLYQAAEADESLR